MENSKHNDELIKRKLANVDIEPSKLNFAKLNTAYQASRKSSNNRRWLLLLIAVGTVGILSFGTYTILNSNNSSELASQNISQKIITAVTEKNSEENKPTIESENEKLIAKVAAAAAEAENKSQSLSVQASHLDRSRETRIETENKKVEATSKTMEKKAAVAAAEAENKSQSLSVGAQSRTETENNKTEANSKTKEKAAVAVAAAVAETKTGKKNTEATSNTKEKKVAMAATEAVKAENKNKESKSKSENKAAAVAAGSAEKKKVDKQNKFNNSGKKEENNKSETEAAVAARQQEEKQNNLNNSEKKEENNKTQTEPEVLNAGKKEENNNPGKTESTKEILAQESVIKEENKQEDKNNNQVKATIKPVEKTEEKKTVINSESKPKTQASPFSISIEGGYLMMKNNITANNTATGIFSKNDPAFNEKFANSYSGNSYNIKNAAVLFGYDYKNKLGLKAGISFIRTQSSNDLSNLSFTTTQSMFDHYIYDSVPQIIDTIYTTISRTLTIVNGDSIYPTTFTNNNRMITIPFQISYHFYLFKRLGIEPIAGIQYAYKISSDEITANSDRNFSYGASKTKKGSLFLDFGLRISYQASRRVAIYASENLSFNAKSVYTNDYALKQKISYLRTALGITFKIGK